MTSPPRLREITVTREQAASFLRTALLSPAGTAGGAGRPSGIVADVVRGLGLVQMDPVRVVGKNHDLVLRNRIAGYGPVHLENALSEKLVFEYICGNRSILPMEEYPFFVPSMKLRETGLKERLESLGSAPGLVLSVLEREGPLPSRAIESEERVSGYWDANKVLRTKATTHALQVLWDCGRVVAGARRNGEIIFDLPERAIPEDLLSAGRHMTGAEAGRFLILKYYRAYRLFDAGHFLLGFQRFTASERSAILKDDADAGLIVPVRIEGVKRRYFCLSEDAERLAAAADREAGPREAATDAGDSGAIRILSPLDNLLWRRERLQDIFGFTYTWELYTPLVKRVYGPYTMPVLRGTAIPLRIDLKFDAERNVLRVLSLYWENHVTGEERSKILPELEGELERLRCYLGAACFERDAE